MKPVAITSCTEVPMWSMGVPALTRVERGTEGMSGSGWMVCQGWVAKIVKKDGGGEAFPDVQSPLTLVLTIRGGRVAECSPLTLAFEG